MNPPTGAAAPAAAVRRRPCRGSAPRRLLRSGPVRGRRRCRPLRHGGTRWGAVSSNFLIACFPRRCALLFCLCHIMCCYFERRGWLENDVDHTIFYSTFAFWSFAHPSPAFATQASRGMVARKKRRPEHVSQGLDLTSCYYLTQHVDNIWQRKEEKGEILVHAVVPFAQFEGLMAWEFVLHPSASPRPPEPPLQAEPSFRCFFISRCCAHYPGMVVCYDSFIRQG